MDELQTSWFKEKKLSWFQTFACNVLKTGVVPKHIAVIMDGNRRYARKKNISRLEGHISGFEKLAEMLQWCRDLDVTEVTIYALSIENFKRPKEEIDNLMDLARDKFTKLLEERDKIMEHGVCIRPLGNLSLLPKDIQKLLAEIEILSCKNNKAFLNVCIAYTSREEVCHAVQELAFGVENGLLEQGDITEDVLQKCLYSRHSPDPDLIVRTSGEVRLSDFLLWQCSYSVLAFVDVLWPEFTFWHFLWAIFYYQINCQKAQEFRNISMKRKERDLEEWAQKCALESCHMKKDLATTTQLDVAEVAQNFKTDRNNRIDGFLKDIDARRLQRLGDMIGGVDGKTIQC